MVEEDKDVDTLENKDADASEKHPTRGRWYNNKKKPRASITATVGKEKFECASDKMKGHVFSIGKNQANVYATTMNALVIQVGIKYSAAVLSAVRELVVKPTILKILEKPELSKLIADGTLTSADTAVPDNLMDLYKEKMNMYARVENKFELDCTSVYLMVKGRCSLNMISELKGFD